MSRSGGLQLLPVIAWVLSLVVHALVLLCGWGVFTQSPRFEVLAGKSATEVDLVAATMPLAPSSPVILAPITPLPVKVETPVEPPSPIRESDELLKPLPVETPKPPQVPTSSPTKAEPGEKVPVPEPTSHASKGALVFNPDYSDNPPPTYPEGSRERHEQGTVILEVEVSKQGLPTKITISKSSGYIRLDRAALQAVRGWRLSPGRIGGVPTDSQVLVPVHFELQNH